MIRNWKKASVGTSLLMAVISLSFYAYTRLHSEPTYQFTNGVEVTPVDVQPDDTRIMLDGELWKFDIMLPAGNKLYYCHLYLCHHGKVIAPLGGVSISSDNLHRRVRVIVGLVPMGANFSEAHQIRYSIRMSDSDMKFTVIGTHGTFLNPLCKGIGYSATPQFSSSNNLIYLMRGSKTGAVYGLAEENDSSIALSVEPIAFKHT